MDLKIAGRLALVTGASSGLGEACALGLAAEGARLILAARRRAKLESVAAAARAAGSPQVDVFDVDLGDAASVDRLLGEVHAIGDPDIFVSNGGGPKRGTYSELSLADWDAAYQPTMRAKLQLIEGLLPAMRAQRWGRIVALESSSIKAPIPNIVLSNAYRAGVLGALKSLSREVAGEGVTVNVIATGRIATDRLTAGYPDPAAFKKMETEIPAKHAGTPAEFAPMVVFLCGEPSGYVTGTTIQIDGGLLPNLF